MTCPHCGRRACTDCDDIGGGSLALVAIYAIHVDAFSADVDRLYLEAMA